MGRRKQSAFEDLIDLAAMLPWWASMLLAVLACVAIHPFAEAPAPTGGAMDDLGQVAVKGLVRTLAMFGQYIVPAAFFSGRWGPLLRAPGRNGFSPTPRPQRARMP